MYFESVIQRRFVKAWLWAFVALFLLSTSAHAIRLNLSGSNLPSGMTGPVKLYRQVGAYDPPGGGDDVAIRLVTISGGILVEPEIPITVSGSTIPLVSGGVENDPGSLTDIVQGTKLYVRVWDGGEGRGHYYAQSTVRTITWLSTDPKVDWDIISWNKYLADVPQRVGVKVNSESLERTGSSLTLTLGIQTIHNGETEPTGAVVEISKDPAFSDVSDSTGGQKHFDSASATVSGSYFTAGTYYIRGQMRNYYGSTPVSLLTAPVMDIPNPGDSVIDAVGRYATLGEGVPCGPETVTITFRTTDDLGINPFSFPFATLTDPAGVMNLKQLIEAVNTEAGENVVTVAGWWNKERQEPWGYIITYNSSALNDFGTFTTAGEVPSDPSGVSLEKDMAYQFSVLKPVSIDATGTR